LRFAFHARGEQVADVFRTCGLIGGQPDPGNGMLELSELRFAHGAPGFPVKFKTARFLLR
jgi:hypothetical protein